ncbi:MAG: NAD(P)-binding protein [Patescibacteria group bacterium]|nr:NAD(P)-binding protein [Patescibacteria group bacterium]
MKKALILGGGFAGCAAAHQLSLIGKWDITLVEKSPFLGAGVRTEWYGGHPYTFGPRHFLTQREDVFEYLNFIVPMRRCQEHEFITYVSDDDAFYNFPIHVDDIDRMPDKYQIKDEMQCLQGVTTAKNFEEYWIGSVGKTLYEKFVNKYSRKMWLVEDNKDIDTFSWSPKGVALKSGPRAAWDTAISAYPEWEDGYNHYFNVATEFTKVLLNTTVQCDLSTKTAIIHGESHSFDIIVNTISPDVPFGYRYGRLGYIGRDFHKIVLPVEHAFPKNVYFVYYAGDEKFTRLVEYKQFTGHKSPHTLLGMEIPSLNGNFYPLPLKSEQHIAAQYFADMAPGVFSIGRNGSYRYSVDIGVCIEQAMAMAEHIMSGSWEHPVPLEKWRSI